MSARRWARLALAMLGAVALVGCTEHGAPAPTPNPTVSPAPSSAPRPGTPTVLLTGLTTPWSILRLGDDDSTLISERDSGKIDEYTPASTLRTAGTVPGVVHGGEGGLLGLAILRESGERWVYAYLTTATDNRIVRMALGGASGGYSLGRPQTILDGLAKAGNHNGGRIEFGPDGMLYATVGDAGQTGRAQDPDSLNGKILRMTPTGDAPADNPHAGSLVYSMGHRNPQGLAWDASGQLWAAEFGQDTWDELNRIEPGANYGWPIVEGDAGQAGFVDPVAQWSTADASPSGLAYADGAFFLAALRGERLWAVTLGDAPAMTAYFTNEFGRLRDVVPGPGDTLWVITNNTDGRGSPGADDDRLLQVPLH